MSNRMEPTDRIIVVIISIANVLGIIQKMGTEEIGIVLTDIKAITSITITITENHHQRMEPYRRLLQVQILKS